MSTPHDSPAVPPFGSGVILGILIITQLSCLSATVVAGLLLYIGVNITVFPLLLRVIDFVDI